MITSSWQEFMAVRKNECANSSQTVLKNKKTTRYKEKNTFFQVEVFFIFLFKGLRECSIFFPIVNCFLNIYYLTHSSCAFFIKLYLSLFVHLLIFLVKVHLF
jgi:hypothetical protein